MFNDTNNVSYISLPFN